MAATSATWTTAIRRAIDHGWRMPLLPRAGDAPVHPTILQSVGRRDHYDRNRDRHHPGPREWSHPPAPLRTARRRPTTAQNGTPDGAHPTGRDPGPAAPATKKDRTHWLYIAVIASVVLGAAVGLFFPEFGKSLKPLGDGFVSSSR